MEALGPSFVITPSINKQKSQLIQMTDATSIREFGLRKNKADLTCFQLFVPE
jgi:hypothetical protein